MTEIDQQILGHTKLLEQHSKKLEGVEGRCTEMHKVPHQSKSSHFRLNTWKCSADGEFVYVCRMIAFVIVSEMNYHGQCAGDGQDITLLQ